jgi:hypothetical protein
MYVDIHTSVNQLFESAQSPDNNIKRYEQSNNVLLTVEQINGILNANGSQLRNMMIINQTEDLPEVFGGLWCYWRGWIQRSVLPKAIRINSKKPEK